MYNAPNKFEYVKKFLEEYALEKAIEYDFEGTLNKEILRSKKLKIKDY